MNVKLSKLVIAALASTSMMGFGGLAHADSTNDIVNALVMKGVLTEEEGALLTKGRTGEVEAAQKKAKSNPTMEVGKKGLVIKGADGDFSMKIGGRMHADYTTHGNEAGLAAAKQPINGSQIRRGRMALSGTVYHDFDYMIEEDFANDAVATKDLFMVYHGFNAPLELTVGHQKHAMSMEIQESSNDIMFTERSFVSALTVPYFDRAIGLNLKGFGDNWNVQSGYYGDSMGTSATKATVQNNEGNGFGVRGTWAPIMEKGKVLHVGLNYGYRNPSEAGLSNGKESKFSYKTTNMSELSVISLTAPSDLDNVKTGIAELSGMYGPLSFQSEFAKTKVSRTSNANADLTAWYAQAGYTLTGESRTYKGSDGEFKRLVPKNNFSLSKGTWGAWEVAGRYDRIDLVDGGLDGGKASRVTASLNWYLNEDVRVLAGYSRSFDMSGNALKKADGSYANNIDVFALRTQWAF